MIYVLVICLCPLIVINHFSLFATLKAIFSVSCSPLSPLCAEKYYIALSMTSLVTADDNKHCNLTMNIKEHNCLSPSPFPLRKFNLILHITAMIQFPHTVQHSTVQHM